MIAANELLKTLMPLGDNSAHIPTLVRALQSHISLIPFVGAGLSVPYHLPEWGPFLISLAPDSESRAEVERLLTEREYEQAAEYIYTVRGPDGFQTLFGRAFAANVDVTFPTAVSSLIRFPPNPVLTTNFDRVIETVFAAAGCTLTVIEGANFDKAREAFQFNPNALLKLHGDAGDRTQRVLTRVEYEKHYSDTLRSLLLNVATRPLLFLGCSLHNDRPMRVLRELKQEGRVLVQHFAVLALPSTPKELRERTHQLTEELQVNPVWYPTGQHEWIQHLLDYLADQTPPERSRNQGVRPRVLHRGLPAAPFQLFGRDEQLHELLDALKSFALVIVEGNRGVGKTAFALHAMRQLLEDGPFGALVWITAAARKERLRLEHLLDAISFTIDYPFTPQTEVGEKEEILVRELEAQKLRCLLLVDNYETVADPDIGSFLFERRPPTLSVLITSAHRVITPAQNNIKVVALDQLKPADALLLFRERQTRDGLEPETEQDLERLYRVVGGNPLALEWLVGQLRGGGEMALILDSLEQGKASILPKVFEQSWGMLDDGPRTILCGLATFVMPALEAGLHAVTRLSADEFQVGLQQLIRMYLLKRLRIHESGVQLANNEPRRYHIHPFTRDFAESQIEQRGGADLYERGADFYLQFVRERGGVPDHEERQAQRELNAERVNMLAVLAGCQKYGRMVPVIMLIEAMARWLFVESHWADLEQWGPVAITAAEASGEHQAAGRIWNEVGRVYSYRSQYQKAENAFDRAQAHANAAQPPDLMGQAYILHHAGEAKLRQRLYQEAGQLLTKSLAQFEALGSRRDLIGVRYRLAVLAFDMGDYADARAKFERGADDCIEENWERLEGFHRRYLGELASRENDSGEARYQLQRALELSPEADMRIQALIELSLARVEQQAERLDQALERATAAQAHFEKIGMRKEADEARRLVLTLKQEAGPDRRE